MAEEKNISQVPIYFGAVKKTEHGPRQILSTMVADFLALARTSGFSVAPIRHYISGVELRDPDYQQILLWSQDLGMTPENVLQILMSSSYTDDDVEVNLKIQDGTIQSLTMDFNLLPLVTLRWVNGFSVQVLAFMGKHSSPLKLCLPKLRILFCPFLGITELDLANLPELTELTCHFNQLTKLDLTIVPKLSALHCGGNQITELELAKVPYLSELSCSYNQITKLDLDNVPGLTMLSCGHNPITKLDLVSLLGLTFLACGDNQLTELDLVNVPGLTSLTCDHSQLTELDLVNVSGLTALSCGHNQIAELNLACTPGLTILVCNNNQLTELDIHNLHDLKSVRVDKTVNVKKRPDQEVRSS